MSIDAVATTTIMGTIWALASHLGQEHRETIISHPRIFSDPSKPFKPFRLPQQYALQLHQQKRVSNHLMKDCRTFMKLQEAVSSNQAKAQSQGYAGTLGQ
jgi:hypothetical protein